MCFGLFRFLRETFQQLCPHRRRRNRRRNHSYADSTVDDSEDDEDQSEVYCSDVDVDDEEIAVSTSRSHRRSRPEGCEIPTSSSTGHRLKTSKTHFTKREKKREPDGIEDTPKTSSSLTDRKQEIKKELKREIRRMDKRKEKAERVNKLKMKEEPKQGNGNKTQEKRIPGDTGKNKSNNAIKKEAKPYYTKLPRCTEEEGEI